jgi:hypothetical protein
VADLAVERKRTQQHPRHPATPKRRLAMALMPAASQTAATVPAT